MSCLDAGSDRALLPAFGKGASVLPRCSAQGSVSIQLQQVWGLCPPRASAAYPQLSSNELSAAALSKSFRALFPFFPF